MVKTKKAYCYGKKVITGKQIDNFTCTVLERKIYDLIEKLSMYSQGELEENNIFIEIRVLQENGGERHSSQA